MSVLLEQIKEVDSRLPHFNDFLIKDYRRNTINHVASFIDSIYSEAIKPFEHHGISFLGHRVATPEERINYVLRLDKSSKGEVQILQTELALVFYIFSYKGTEFSLPMFLPYTVQNGFVIVNDTKYMVNLAISDKIFSILKTGILVKLVRMVLKFYNNETFQVNSITSDYSFFDYIVTCRLHNKTLKKNKSIPKPTCIHYLCCKYGLPMVLKIFKFKVGDFEFVYNPDLSDADTYDYFPAERVKKSEKCTFFMKVNKAIYADNTKKKVLITLLYILSKFNDHRVEDIFGNDGTYFKILLGRIIYPELTDIVALDRIDGHLVSVDGFLDPINAARLKSMNIFLEDTYQLLTYMFNNIASMKNSAKASNLYEKRIDALDGLLVQSVVVPLSTKLYKLESLFARKCNAELIKKNIRVPPKLITSIFNSPIVSNSPSLFNDNWLLAIGSKKTRVSSISDNRATKSNSDIRHAPENRFHPSASYVESLVAYSSSSPDSTGTINPFLQINEHGFIIKADYTAELDPLEELRQ